MKRSEFFEIRDRYWIACWGYGETTGSNQSTRDQATKDCQAAEAAGVAWDPEQEPLPVALRLSGSGGAIVNPEAGDFVAHIPNNPAAHATAGVMVYRYNAWKRLQTFRLRLASVAQGEAGLTFAMLWAELGSILDGKEAES